MKTVNNISIHDDSMVPIAKSPIETEDRGSIEREINPELYSAGFIDGLTGLNAELLHFKDYWSGYALGYREYCCGLLGVEIPNEEIPTDTMASLMNA